MWRFRNKINDYMTAVATDSEGELWIYGDIVDTAWWDDEVSPVTTRDTLNSMGSVDTLNLRVNSNGGSVVAGNAIINIIDSYKQKAGARVVAYIEGLAASMGSGIPMVADKIYMAENAMYMLHKPLTFAYGNADDLEKGIETLDKVEDTLVVNYMRHFKGTEDELRQLMADETWLTATEALEYGLCDEIIPAVKVVASAKGVVIDGLEFKQNTETLNSKFTPNQPANTPVDHPTAEFISAQAAKNALGREMTPDEIFAFAKLGMETDPKADDETKTKAQAYDKLVNAAIEDAIKNGVRAKGEAFNETKWRKILSSLDYSEVLDQSDEWIKDAKSALNAGKRASDIEAGMNGQEVIINVNDYTFC